MKFTKAAALWGSLIFGFLILIVLLIFIAQNTESAEFAFLNLSWSLPLGVAILFAAVAGGLLTVAVGAVRAALWTAGRPPGLYSMQDVLALKP